MADYEDFWLTAEDGLRLHARDYGNAAGRFPVLCLHGLTRNAMDFAALADRLAGDYRVVVMEQRGRGDSDYDPDPTNYQLATYVRDAFALLDALQLERPALIGTSMGGLMAMAMASMAPERFRGLVLNDIGPVVEPAGVARIRGYVGRAAAADDWNAAMRSVRANNEAAFPTFDEDDWLAFTRRLFREAGDGTLRPAYDVAIAQPMGTGDAAAPPAAAPSMAPWEQFEALAGLPILVIRGVLSDILSAATVAEMARRHPGLQTVEVPQTGHAPMLTEAPAVSAIEAFLRRL